MFENIQVFEDRYVELEKDLINVDVINNSALYQKTAIEHAELEPIVHKYRAVSYTHLTLPTNREV